MIRISASITSMASHVQMASASALTIKATLTEQRRGTWPQLWRTLKWLAKERELGRVIGPLTSGSLQLQINRFGVILKSGQPGKWRLIVDLSHPDGFSINDGIEPELCSLSYASVGSSVAVIMRL